MPKPLDKIRVIEVNRVAPGSFCTMLLADMGAEVIRIDMPEKDPAEAERRRSDPAESRRVLSNFLDRGKQSLTLNMKEPAAQRVFARLAKDADVVVEGFRPGVMARLGADYETLSELNPRLVYCSLSGFGQDGPYRDLPAHDLNYISLAGVLGLLSPKGTAPPIPLNLIADYAGATMHGVMGILLALFAREHTGKGQLVDVSYLDATVSLLSAVPSMWSFFETGRAPDGEGGVFSGEFAYYTSYRTKDDQWLSIGCMEPWLWHNLCDVIERPDLKDCAFDTRHFYDKAGANQESARRELGAVLATKTRDEWFALFSRADVCAGKINSVEEVFRDPQVLHRQMLVEREHPVAGTIRQPGVAVKLSDTPGEVPGYPPFRGEHSDELLASLGYSPAEISDLREKGAV